jgi:hypothetical protein
LATFAWQNGPPARRLPHYLRLEGPRLELRVSRQRQAKLSAATTLRASGPRALRRLWRGIRFCYARLGRFKQNWKVPSRVFCPHAEAALGCCFAGGGCVWHIWALPTSGCDRAKLPQNAWASHRRKGRLPYMGPWEIHNLGLCRWWPK